MTGQEKLEILALIVSIFVIIGITICFSLLFFLYSFYKRKQINFGLEDDSIMNEFNSIYLKKKSKKNKENITKLEVYKKDKRNNRIYHNILDVFTGIFVLAFFLIFAVGLTFSTTDNNVSLFGRSYLTIVSSSMEEANSSNTYLSENELTDQITQYSLISIKKVDSVEDIKKYDIIAFKLKASEVSDSLITYSNSFKLFSNDSNISETSDDTTLIIVHRVIDIYDGSSDQDESTLSGTTYFTTRGDSNTQSLNEEIAISFDKIVGVYTGFNNYYLGVFIIYFKSSIGIIACLSATIFLLLAAISEEKITKSYDVRLLNLINDEESETSEKTLNNNETTESEEVTKEEVNEEEVIKESKKENNINNIDREEKDISE